MKTKINIYRGEDKDPNECWRWRMKDTNGQIIATGGEAFTKDGVIGNIKNIKASITAETPIVLDGSEEESGKESRFAYFQGKDGQYYWRLQNKGNNEIIAVGGEGFVSKDSVLKSLENVRKEISLCPEHVWENPSDDPAQKAKEADSTKSRGIAGSCR